IVLAETPHLFGGTEAAIPYARDYLIIILWGNIFQHISFGMSNIVRSEGSAMTAMGVVILGAALNIILDPIFIFVFHMGIRGAAWATVISMAISSVWVMAHFLRGSVLTLRLKHIRIYPKLFTRVLAIGLAPCLMQILHCLIVIIYNHSFIAYASSDAEATLAIAAFGIVNSVLMMALMPSFGINMGMQPIVGYNTGAKLYPRVIHTMKLAVSLATVICLVLALICIAFSKQIAFILTPDKPLVGGTVYSVRAVSCGLPFIGVGILTGTYYLSIGRSSISIVLSMLRQGIVLIPVLLIMPRFFGLNGIWWAGPVADTFSAILCFAMLIHEFARLRKLIAAENAQKVEA
ncbi:MAG: MATE family efflux transporter, partial [Lentisphaeria bacterium]|nr:MATE family efflux transporter [Lentisphaeria bacterium]